MNSHGERPSEHQEERKVLPGLFYINQTKKTVCVWIPDDQHDKARHMFANKVKLKDRLIYFHIFFVQQNSYHV